MGVVAQWQSALGSPPGSTTFLSSPLPFQRTVTAQFLPLIRRDHDRSSDQIYEESHPWDSSARCCDSAHDLCTSVF